MITVLHPWHGAHYGPKAPEHVTALIENFRRQPQ